MMRVSPIRVKVGDAGTALPPVEFPADFLSVEAAGAARLNTEWSREAEGSLVMEMGEARGEEEEKVAESTSRSREVERVVEREGAESPPLPEPSSTGAERANGDESARWDAKGVGANTRTHIGTICIIGR